MKIGSSEKVLRFGFSEFGPGEILQGSVSMKVVPGERLQFQLK